MSRVRFIKYILQLKYLGKFYRNRTLFDGNGVEFVAKIVALIENDRELKRFEAVKAV